MKISEKKYEKISEQILLVIFSYFPKLMFTSQIAQEIARDEEFVKKILLDLKNKSIIKEIKKNNEGKTYKRRSRWKLQDNVYLEYKKHQNNTSY